MSIFLKNSLTIQRIQILLIIIAISFFRPTILGEQFTSVGIVLSVLSLFLYILFQPKDKFQQREFDFGTTIMSLTLFFYLFIQGLLIDSSNVDIISRSIVANVIAVVIFGYILSDNTINRLLFRCIVIIWSVLGYSTIVTLLLTQVTSLDTLFLFQIPTDFRSTVNGYGNIYLPFSIYYVDYSSAQTSVVLYRFMGMFREPGILQGFLVWAIIYSLHYKISKWVILGLICGLITTFATGAYALLTGTLFLWYASQSPHSLGVKAFLGVLGVVLFPIVLFYAPYIGIIDKFNTHGISIDVRTRAMVDGINLALTYPFGYGYYSLRGDNQGINLIALTGQIGFLGSLLSLFVYCAPLLKINKYKWVYAIAIFPVFATAIFSQPLLDAPMVYILFFASFNNSKLVDNQHDYDSSSTRKPSLAKELSLIGA